MIWLQKMNKMKRIIETIFDSNGKMHHYSLRKEWYISNNILHIYDLIFETTVFLDEYDPSIRERIFYIKNNFTHIQLCPYCNARKLKYRTNTVSLTKTCSNKECKGLHKSKLIIDIMNNRSEEEWDKIKHKISVANKGRKFTIEHCNKLKDCNLGRKQTNETKLKRYVSRKNNGGTWHTEETKNKISASNRETWSKPEYIKLKQKLTEENKSKQSLIMKKKIKNGEFTPNITNSWTSWESFVNIGNTKKKFRSSWEAVFYLLNNGIQYEQTRIPYIYDYYSYNYIVDFTDNENRILYEIKPESEITDSKTKSKIKFANEWCKKNDYFFVIISDSYFKRNAKRINFKEQPQLKNPMRQFL